MKNQQYKDSTNLEARIKLHQRFSTNPYGWWSWLWDHINLQAGERVLEVGCGPGSLWQANLDRLPESLAVALSDLSHGMATKARSNLGGVQGCSFAVLDAQNLPFADRAFDRLIANYMLFHVPDIQAALSEFKRLLKPGGMLFAATAGNNNLRELSQLIRDFLPDYVPTEKQTRRFALENAAEILRPYFSHVQVVTYFDELQVTEVEPLLAYIRSMWDVYDRFDEQSADQFEIYVREVFSRANGFTIHKYQGLVVAWDEIPQN